MIQVEFTVCTLDDRPIEASPLYKAIRRFLGKKLADKLTYIKIVPPDEA